MHTITFYSLEDFKPLQVLRVKRIEPIQLNRIAIGIEHETNQRVTWRHEKEPAPQNKQMELKLI
jgi:hypothetical protein